MIDTEEGQLATSIVNDTTAAADRYNKFSKSLYADILLVQEKSSEIYTNIKNSPSHIIGIIIIIAIITIIIIIIIIGIEILKAFFVDLIGRDTDDADIFTSSFDTNLRVKPVMPIYVKAMAIMFILCMDMYFVYISVQTCADKSYDWQLHWLLTLVTNFCIDVSFNSVSETYILKFMVPMVINNKIGTTTNTTNTIVTILTTTNTTTASTVT